MRMIQNSIHLDCKKLMCIVTLASSSTTSIATGSHTFFLEELNLKLVNYYLKGCL